MRIEFQTSDAPDLWKLPPGSVLSLAGSGGKTTLLHHLAEYYRSMGVRVLAGTTTHMLLERDVCGTRKEVLASLDQNGYAMGGLPDPCNPRKMVGFPSEIWEELTGHADLTILEADGSRRFPFKVPKSHEPCVPAFSTKICVLFGSAAVGRTIREAAYNPEGAVRVFFELGYPLPTDPFDAVLSEEMIRAALDFSYGRRLGESSPGIPFSVMKAVLI